MENRRLFSFKKNPALCSSTRISPQLEHYSLYTKPLLTKRLKEQCDKGTDDFGLFVNVGNAKPSEIKIIYGKGDTIEIKIEQPPTPFNGMTFARDCSYKYELPKNVDKSTLKALKTRDNYLIILSIDMLREDWEKSRWEEPEDLEKPVAFLERLQAGVEEETNEPIVLPPAEEPAKEAEEPAKEAEAVEGGENLLDEVALEKRRKESDEKCPPGSQLEMTEMNRILKPYLDFLVLRKRLLNIERYVSRIRKYVENSSFILEDKMTVERCVYDSAKQSRLYFHGKGVEEIPA